MKKSAFLGASMALVMGLFPIASTFAASSLDYIKSLGKVDGADSVNYYVEGVSGGGYIVGGQTLGCKKYKRLNNGHTYEMVDMQECVAYYEEHPNALPDYSNYPSVFDYYCGRGIFIGPIDPGTGGAFQAAPSPYFLTCVDYIAKFKQNGTKEWLTKIDDSKTIAGIGETNTDYRLVDVSGAIITVDKNTGAEGMVGQINSDELHLTGGDAIINANGTTVLYDNQKDEITLYGANGNMVRTLGRNDNIYISTVDGLLARDDNKIPAIRWDEETEIAEAVLISSDLSQIESLYVLPEDEFIHEYILSIDNDNNIAYSACVFDNGAETDDCFIVSYNKDGNVIGTVTAEDNPDLLESYMTDNYIAATEEKLMLLNPDLSVKYAFDINDESAIYDATYLNDGSLVAVGFAAATTADYEVDGARNGLYLRIRLANSTTPTTNPNTVDDSRLFIAGIVAAILFAAGVVFRNKRR